MEMYTFCMKMLNITKEILKVSDIGGNVAFRFGEEWTGCPILPQQAHKPTFRHKNLQTRLQHLQWGVSPGRKNWEGFSEIS